MTETEQQRYNWHLDVAACRIRSGCNRHLDLLSLGDLELLCRYLNCGIGELLDRFYMEARTRNPQPPPTPLFDGPDDGQRLKANR